MRFVRAITLAAVVIAAFAQSGRAQVTGQPVRNSGISSGLTLAAEVGFPNVDYGKGTAFGGRGAVGFGPLGVSAVISTYNPKVGPTQTGLGGYLNLKVFGGPLVPFSVTLQGGAEYVKNSGTKLIHAPIGLGIAVKIPNPALAIKPWIAPRFDIVRVSPTGLSSTTEKNFGISGGIDFSLLGGFGFGAAYDRTWADHGLNPSVFSVGANYAIKIPGL
jgi:hypothetical protein